MFTLTIAESFYVKWLKMVVYGRNYSPISLLCYKLIVVSHGVNIHSYWLLTMTRRDTLCKKILHNWFLLGIALLWALSAASAADSLISDLRFAETIPCGSLSVLVRLDSSDMSGRAVRRYAQIAWPHTCLVNKCLFCFVSWHLYLY